MSSSSNGGLQIMLPLFHSPLFHFKAGMPLASKNFRSTFLSLVWWSNVATIQPITTLALVQPLTVTADTIQKYIWCSHNTCTLIVSNSNSRRGQIVYVFNAHYMFAHCAETGKGFGPQGAVWACASKHWHNIEGGGGGGIVCF